jgi:hypothetical protein
MRQAATAVNPIIFIPARLGSTRLPGKALALISGKPMIAHVLARGMEADLGPVVVATDAREIAEAVEAAGGQAVMTMSSSIYRAISRSCRAGRSGPRWRCCAIDASIWRPWRHWRSPARKTIPTS